MNKCSGTVIIALERTYFPSGVEKRGGPNATSLIEARYPSPWNQIEAGMAYSRGHPLMVIVEKGLRQEGLLERGNEWYVQCVDPTAPTLTTLEFNGVLASWKEKVAQYAVSGSPISLDVGHPEQLTIGQLVKNMKPSHLWSSLAALAALAGGSFALGGKLFHIP
jgi:hypothetical protein